jgi:hypothetical protein
MKMKNLKKKHFLHEIQDFKRQLLKQRILYLYLSRRHEHFDNSKGV